MYNRTRLGVTDKLAYVLIYLIPFVGSLVFLISDGKNRDIRGHCLMSLYLSLAELAAALLLSLLGKIPYVGWIFTFSLWLISVAYAGAMLLSMSRALHDKVLKVPFFYNMVKRTL